MHGQQRAWRRRGCTRCQLGLELHPQLRAEESAAPAPSGIQVSSPVTDSVITSIDCNCHCQDHSVFDFLVAFSTGAVAAFALFCILRQCGRYQAGEEEYAEETFVERRAPRAIADNVPVPRRVVVTLSTRRYKRWQTATVTLVRLTLSKNMS